MPRLRALDPAQAPWAARTLLADIIDRHGGAGPMVRTMAHQPALLQAHHQLRSDKAVGSVANGIIAHLFRAETCDGNNTRVGQPGLWAGVRPAFIRRWLRHLGGS